MNLTMAGSSHGNPSHERYRKLAVSVEASSVSMFRGLDELETQLQDISVR